MSRRSMLIGSLAACALVVTSCGGSPNSDAGGDGGDSAAAGVYDEVNALSGQERRDRLVELAEEEGNTLSLYTSLNAEIADLVVPAFEDEFGIDVELYRADSETILQRILQESSAGFAGADVVETNANELAVISSEELTADYESVERDAVNEEFQYDGWTPSRFNLFAPAWNTNDVSGDLIPTSWEDLADPKYDGILSLEVGDYDWYMTLYGYFQDQGMSDEEIDQLFADMVNGSKIAKGHSGQVELLSAGEFSVVAAAYSYLTEQARADGAPVDDQPFIEPIIARANGGAPLLSSEHPGTSVLFMDWYLSDGQQILLDNGLTPSVLPGGGDPLADIEVLPVDVQQLLDEGRDWSDRYDELVQNGEQLPEN